jgi:hypothetical protein
MNEDRRKILDMLAAGKVTADEAERLLAALTDTASAAPSKPKPKYIRVTVQEEGDRKGATNVNIRVPMQLLRAGVKFANLIPPEARERVNIALHKEGVPIDLSQIKPENLDELVDHLDELTVDINEKNTKVRVFCE